MKESITISDLYNDLRDIIESIQDPSDFNYEMDFERVLKEKLAKQYSVSSEVQTMPHFDRDGERKSWRIDLVIKVNNTQYVPIELKYKDSEDNICFYGRDYIEDVDRIKYLLLSYDDVPYGFAICLTSRPEIIELCRTLKLNYNIVRSLIDRWHSMQIEWFNHKGGKFFYGIAGWRWGGNKDYITNKYFKPFWDKKQANEMKR